MQISLSERENLLKKQEILNKISKIELQILNIPEQLEIKKLLVSDSDEKKTLIDSQIHDMKIEIQRYKTDLNKVNENKEKNNEQLASGRVSTVEINYINTDIARQSKRQQELNRKVLEIEEKIKDGQKTIDELDEKIIENNNRVESLKNQVNEKSKVFNKEKENLLNELSQIKLSDKIDEIFQLHISGGIAVATLNENNMCSACQMVQPTTIINSTKKISETEIVFCEECDRILLK